MDKSLPHSGVKVRPPANNKPDIVIPNRGSNSKDAPKFPDSGNNVPDSPMVPSKPITFGPPEKTGGSPEVNPEPGWTLEDLVPASLDEVVDAIDSKYVIAGVASVIIILLLILR